VVSVLPDVAGLDRCFDYTVPPALGDEVRVGTVVRVELAGRRVGGWVLADGVGPPPDLPLRPLAAVRGWGPEPAVVGLSEWAAWRWAGRRRALLGAASPAGAVRLLPAATWRPPPPPAGSDRLGELVRAALVEGTSVLTLPPASDPIAVVAHAAQAGPTLVVVPSSAQAQRLAARLRRAGAGVALLPEQWGLARAGAAVVVGARGAVWAPCPGMRALVVLDAHDQNLVQQQTPAWWATTVAVERARRQGVPALLVTPCPTLDLLAASGDPAARPAGRAGGAGSTRPSPRTALLRLDPVQGRAGWAPLEVVDRCQDDPRLGLYSERLVRAVREAERTLCVLNRTGRARLLVCAACGAPARCERCGAALTEVAPSEEAGASGPGRRRGLPLGCPRCGEQRPPLCAPCGSSRLRHLRPGVGSAAEDLAVLAGRRVEVVTAASGSAGATTADADGAAAPAVIVGTEAALHRSGPLDLVAFLDFDQHLLAPRLRAGEEALGLLVKASRLVGGRRRGGRVLVQTRLPAHPVLEVARSGDPDPLLGLEAATRRELRLPPWSSLATLSGPGANELAEAVGAEGGGVEVLGAGEGRFTLRAGSPEVLCDALARVGRPAGRVRVEVDPIGI